MPSSIQADLCGKDEYHFNLERPTRIALTFFADQPGVSLVVFQGSRAAYVLAAVSRTLTISLQDL
jgi:hypothetical protein